MELTINRKKPKTMEQLKDIWYAEDPNSSRTKHYNSTRYHGLNLHATFTKGTVEFRIFNSTPRRISTWWKRKMIFLDKRAAGGGYPLPVFQVRRKGDKTCNGYWGLILRPTVMWIYSAIIPKSDTETVEKIKRAIELWPV